MYIVRFVICQLCKRFGSTGIAVVFAMILGQGPGYALNVGWALAQELRNQDVPVEPAVPVQIPRQINRKKNH